MRALRAWLRPAGVSSTHNVAARDYWIAMVSTTVETSTPERELEAGFQLLGPITEKFVSIVPIYAPGSSGTRDNVFITRSYDATSHFETVTDDVRDVWRCVGGAEAWLTVQARHRHRARAEVAATR